MSYTTNLRTLAATSEPITYRGDVVDATKYPRAAEWLEDCHTYERNGVTLEHLCEITALDIWTESPSALMDVNALEAFFAYYETGDANEIVQKYIAASETHEQEADND
jgi:hypothetical protein